MSLSGALERAGIAPVGGSDVPLAYRVFAPDEYSPLNPRPAPRNTTDPLVSCLLVTNGDRSLIRHAIECYRRQLYANRELVVVTHPDGLASVTETVDASGAPNVTIHSLGRDMTLGDCRNVAIARARGDIVTQWDDDDLYDPHRLTVAVAVLTKSPAVAAMLTRVLVWWPKRRLAAISERRTWEGSMAVWRAHAPAYPSLARGEDTPAVEAVVRTRTVASYDLPLLYVYTVHERNTWDTPHFEEIIDNATCVLEGADYDELMNLLSDRMPVREYLRDAA